MTYISGKYAVPALAANQRQFGCRQVLINAVIIISVTVASACANRGGVINIRTMETDK
jgi:hypothetical protein